MSFEEAIRALEMKDFNLWHTSYTHTGQPNQTMLVDETGVSGYLMWFAPNGTFYEAKYPNGNPLGEIGHLTSVHNLNPPEGFFIWELVDQSGMSGYWVLADNGTIVDTWPLRGSGPVTGPPPIFELIALTLTLIFVVGIGLLVYFKKRKRAG